MPEYVIPTAAFLINLFAIFTALYRLGRAVEKFESIGMQQSEEIKGLKNAVTVVAELVTKSALQTERMNTMSSRIERNERLLEDLRRGEGWILPLDLGAKKVG